jgi:hypothetical protein
MDHPTAVLAAAALALVCWARPAAACCTTYGRDGRVAIADQEILIVWDAERRFERFVRRAAFETTGSRDFGFLVPTPSKPALAEVPNIVFDRLREATRPKVVSGYTIDFMPLVLSYYGLRSARSRGPADAALEPVRVLDRQTVAGYDAVVLEADDAAALAGWLRTHGYDSRPEIDAWAKPYVAAQWKITAFKYAQAAAPGEARSALAARVATTGAVSLSFATDRPLFPYRVPTDQLARPERGHVLRVFFIGADRVEATLGPAAAPWWQGVARYANRVEGLHSLLAGVAPPDALAEAGWITMFEDRTWPGGTEDLFFRRNSDAAPIVPVVDGRKAIPLPLDVLVFLAGGGLWLLRRRGAAAPGPPR